MFTLKVKISISILIFIWFCGIFGCKNFDDFLLITLFFGFIIGISLLRRYVNLKSIAKEQAYIENEIEKEVERNDR